MGEQQTINAQLAGLLGDLGTLYNGSCLTFLREWRESSVWVPDRDNVRANRAWFFGHCRPFAARTGHGVQAS